MTSQMPSPFSCFPPCSFCADRYSLHDFVPIKRFRWYKVYLLRRFVPRKRFKRYERVIETCFVRGKRFRWNKSRLQDGAQAVEFALKNGRITNTDVQEMSKVSKPTATRLLTSLSDYLELKGTTGKGTYYTVKGLTKGSRQHCFVLLNTRTCLEGNPHVHRPCGIRRFHSLSDSQIYYREHQTSSDSLYNYIVELTL